MTTLQVEPIKIFVKSNYKVNAAVLDFLNLEISVYCFYHVLLLITVQ